MNGGSTHGCGGREKIRGGATLAYYGSSLTAYRLPLRPTHFPTSCSHFLYICMHTSVVLPSQMLPCLTDTSCAHKEPRGVREGRRRPRRTRLRPPPPSRSCYPAASSPSDGLRAQEASLVFDLGEGTRERLLGRHRPSLPFAISASEVDTSN